MVKGALVEGYTRAGRLLLEELGKHNVEVPGALWLFRETSNSWVLLLEMPEADRSGPLAAYRQVREVFSAIQESLKPLLLEDIEVVEPNDALMKALHQAVQTGPGISETRFSGNRVGDTIVEDALIYRMI